MTARSKRLPAWVPALTAGLLLSGFGARSPEESPPVKDAALRGHDRRTDRKESRGLIGVIRIVAKRIDRQRVVLVAAGVTFYSLLALFPGIAALVTLYGLVADPVTIGQQVDNLTFLLPSGAIELIHGEIARITAQPRSTLGLTLAVSLAFSLWSANGGMKALFEALDVVYLEKETRGFFGVTAVSLAFVVGGIVFVIIAITGVVAVPIALHYLGIPSLGKSIISFARWPILFIVVAIAIAFVYRFGPDRKTPRRRWISWGSATAAFAWIATSVAFSWYTENFGSYNKTYGSLGAVVGFMTWIWLSTIVFLIGAEIDSVLERRTAGRGRPAANQRSLFARSVEAGTSSE
ncbi:MAG TPA: YihY/virulence factor BrkB family protein [Casimicrobiaceae bacterium]